MAEISIDVEWDPVRVIPVPVTAVDVIPILGPCKLSGWSLRDATGDAPSRASGNATSPGANGIIATLSGFAAGTYFVNWTVGLEGTLGVGDANNMYIALTGASQLPSINPGVVGEYPQQQLELTMLATDNLSVKATAAATVGANYSADITIIPVSTINTICEIQDGNNVLGEVAVPNPGCDTHWFGGDGLQVRAQIKLHIISGAVTGAIYARFQKLTG
jgi:hypothetical protein